MYDKADTVTVSRSSGSTSFNTWVEFEKGPLFSAPRAMT